MGKNSKFRIMLNRRKYIKWETGQKLKIISTSLIVLAVIVFSIVLYNNVHFNSTKIVQIADGTINDEIRNNLIDIYSLEVQPQDCLKEIDIYSDISTVTENNTEEIEEEFSSDKDNTENNKVYVDNIVEKDNVTFTVVGELMMGAEVTENLDYQYLLAFKTITDYTRYADFTYGVISTNITKLSTISNVKSKYLVTENIGMAFATLGIDALNIATSHIADYDKTIFTTTLDTLKKNNVYIVGINGSTLYVNVCGKKIAIIGELSSYIGDKIRYTEFGINMYEKEKMIEEIKLAKENADFVIVDICWGRDDIFGMTSSMEDMAKVAVYAGANLVLGSNALGIYPVYELNGVPIIYSTGYLITDSDLNLAKMSYIWEFNINSENRIDKLTMIPVCSENKTYTKDFRISNSELCSEFNALTNKWNEENGLNSTLNDNGTITVNF